MDDAFRELGRRRAREEREAIEWAVAEVRRRSRAAGLDRSSLVDRAEATLAGLPSRHRAAFEGMAETLAVDREHYLVYSFSFSELARELTGTEPVTDGSGAPGEGCTNVLVAASHSATDGPLVLKNRDIVGRGLRPTAIVEQPAIGPYRGFVTVDTCGTPLYYKGANDAGLVVANTYVERERDDVGPREGVRNGTVVRRALEECESVDDARELVEDLVSQLLTGQTLVLADATDAVVLEVDPIEERVQPLESPVVARTNHFGHAPAPRPDSSDRRLARTRSLLEEIDGPISRADLERVATDHAGGPGEYSICRHADADHEPDALDQRTTVSAAILEGGTAAVDAALGYPCRDGFARRELGEGGSDERESGERWLEAVRPR